MNDQSTGAPYTLSVTLPLAYPEAVSAVREALAEQGFGILTQIDLAATMKVKLDKDMAPQVILGACRPPLAYEALQADPSVATMLPCNVVVRALDETTSKVEAFDPDAMMSFSTGEAIAQVAADAKQRLVATLDHLTTQHPTTNQES
ncbi:MAG: DUF302 domain-containing protein [Actinomycetota bacterium]|nr:DUF302 domain-containing protein [Actinomycetota bacterium]